ncbi:oligosaccharide flippase family protein [Rhodoferax sp. U2-2l]|uniref:oligosaccharide flippase family protein n=1 Tax=Rhodoferax sp. U2-2l TaxID=2884000 RepID=UPI001D0AC4D2|nr:oligosaccharide flippase family protein [Rhodoferax sp. U2-2l]MCB8747165.1 oligosaccharide flippase family protein [Rhodoferax sp. U2-2l]
MTSSKGGDRSKKADLIIGAIWAVASRWAVKSIGLISTVILARFLTPQDYGVVSMAFLVVALVEAFLNTGAAHALVRLGPNPTVNQINSAWTLRGLQGCVLALVLAAVAPLAAIYFKEPRVAPIIWVVSVGLAFMGFSNIGMTLAYRDLKFAVEFKLALYTKLVAVTVTLLAALYFADYRALVSGILAGFVTEWLLSYRLHSYRPHWCTKNIKEIWAISKWLLVAGIGRFFLYKTDQLVAGRVGTTQEYGLYTVGADIGQLPTGELGPTLTRPLFPILSAMKHDWERAKAAALKTLASANTITIPMGFGLAAVSEQATLLLLGSQWTDATPFVAGFAIIGTVKYLTSPISTLLNVAGHVRVQSRIVWMEFAAFVALAFLLTPLYHLNGLMLARIGSGLFHAALMLFAARQHMQLSLRKSLSAFVRPLGGSLLMYGLLVTLGDWFAHPMVNLMFNVLMGAIFYTTWLLLTWRLAKCPDGLESTLIEFVQAKLKRGQA